jgi:uncharacterized protein YidB (DUF937 family)
MGLFDQVLGAIDNPNQQASSSQISNILSAVQQLSGDRNVPPSTTQTVLSIVGRHVRSALQQKRSSGNSDEAETLVERFSGTHANSAAVQSLFNRQQEEETVQDTARQTGLDMNTVRAMLPILIPIVLNLLQSGASTQRTPNRRGSNSVLDTFLGGQDGQVDIGDAVALASQFLNQRSR